MSRKTTIFMKKIKQLRSKNASAPATDILPTSRVKGTGRMTIIALVDTVDEDGRTVKAGRRGPGRATNAIVTEPIDEAKRDRLIKLGK